MIAFDLLVFQVASSFFETSCAFKSLDVQFRRPKPNPAIQTASTMAVRRNSGSSDQPTSLSLAWLKPKGTETERYEAFRVLPEAATKLELLLAYCVALTLQPKLGPVQGDEATGYDDAVPCR